MRVIGAGFGRTGTQSLKNALEQLGFGPCYHMDELNKRPQDLSTWVEALAGEPVHWSSLFSDYESAVDWPTCTFWAELHQTFPDAKVILTTRDPDGWYDSVVRTVKAITDAGLMHASGEQLRQIQFGNELIFEQTFGGRFDDREHAIGTLNEHLALVREAIEPARLLEFRAGDGWQPLCDFLGVGVPESDFPHTNTADAFDRRVLGVSSQDD